MAIILCIETSGPVCSVALWSSENNLIQTHEHANSFDHAKVLSTLIDTCCKNAEIELSKLSAIAVSAGPGSYTGLRIGVSTAKGLCFALDIPLIAIDTLKIMASRMRSSFPEATRFIPMIDARRMEVFFAIYDQNLTTIHKPQPKIVDETFLDSMSKEFLLAGGSGAQKLVDFNVPERFNVVEHADAHAQYMGALAGRKFAMEQFEDVAYFEPWYTKAFYTPKRTT